MKGRYDPRTTPWVIDDADFYEIESFDKQLEFLLQYAVLAPSSRNAQPWVFSATADGVEVRADYSRRLAVADPDDREMLLSIGAAIANLRIAAAHFGLETTVLYTSKPDSPGMVAFVAFRKTSQTDPDLRRLFPAIKERHTNRHPFDHEPIEPEVLERVCDFVERHPETLRVVVPHDRQRIVDLVMLADERQMSDGAFREELSDWVYSGTSRRTDGIAADGLGFPPGVCAAADWVLRHVDTGTIEAKRDRGLIDTAAALIIVAAEDDRVSLVAAGEIMERLLLTVTHEGLHYSFFNSPVEIIDLRRNLWTLIGTARPPQLLLRVGRARVRPRPMPRRPVQDALA